MRGAMREGRARCARCGRYHPLDISARSVTPHVALWGGNMHMNGGVALRRGRLRNLGGYPHLGCNIGHGWLLRRGLGSGDGRTGGGWSYVRWQWITTNGGTAFACVWMWRGVWSSRGEGKSWKNWGPSCYGLANAFISERFDFCLVLLLLLCCGTIIQMAARIARGSHFFCSRMNCHAT